MLKSRPPSIASVADDASAANLQRLAVGDVDALGSLYDLHAPVALALAQRILRNRQESEDLVHDVFLEAWAHAADFDASRGSVRSWLLMRVRSRALDRIKSARSRESTLAEHIRSSGTVERPTAGPTDHAGVHEALATLTDEVRSVIEFAFFMGLSSAEIARRSGVPIGTVKSRRARGVRELQAALSHMQGEAG
jgi:RNA polymerase sigma-70 factor (ECF subfamily)